MEHLTTGSFLNDQLIKALSNTLMHSLWQGLLLAVAGGLIIVFTRKASAARRYCLLTGALLLFFLGSLFTFIWEMQPLSYNTAVYKNSITAINLPASSPGNIERSIGKQPVTDVLVNFLNTHSNPIVLIWFLIICAKGIKLATELQRVYHLKHTQVYNVSPYWERRMLRLTEVLRIKQTIRFAESGIAKIPMVIGHLKPLILIPVGFINALSAEEVEAILVHELAHILRKDYLVNLLQNLIEIVFFFNPGVLWISQLIKVERENCCDDIAVGHTGSKAAYIQALLSCHEHQLAAPALSMALAGNKSRLLSRVKRIVNNHNQTLNIMEKSLLTICLVSAGLFTAAFSAKDAEKKRPVVEHLTHINRAPHVNAIKIKGDTLLNKQLKIYNPADYTDGTTIHMRESKNGKTETVYLFKRKGVLYQLNMNRGEVGSLFVNGKAAPADQYRAKIDALLEEHRYTAVPPRPPVPAAPVPQVRVMTARRDLRAPAAPAEPSAPGVAAPPVPAVSIIPPPPPIAMNSPAMPAMAPLPPPKPDVSLSKVTIELLKSGVIKDEDNYEIHISNDALVVDGVKQPEALHQQILKKLVKKPGDKVDWTYTNHN